MCEPAKLIGIRNTVPVNPVPSCLVVEQSQPDAESMEKVIPKKRGRGRPSKPSSAFNPKIQHEKRGRGRRAKYVFPYYNQLIEMVTAAKAAPETVETITLDDAESEPEPVKTNEIEAELEPLFSELEAFKQNLAQFDPEIVCLEGVEQQQLQELPVVPMDLQGESTAAAAESTPHQLLSVAARGKSVASFDLLCDGHGHHLPSHQTKKDDLPYEFLELVKKSLLDQAAEIQLRRNEEISKVKKKQWCWVCEKESIYSCCWNTSYCSKECQWIHWKDHEKNCRRTALNK